MRLIRYFRAVGLSVAGFRRARGPLCPPRLVLHPVRAHRQELQERHLVELQVLLRQFAKGQTDESAAFLTASLCLVHVFWPANEA